MEKLAMKTILLLLALAIPAATLRADDLAGALALAPNGDLTMPTVTPRTQITLTTNAEYRVVCQVAYRDQLNPTPVEPDDFRKSESMDKFLTLGLELFLHEYCNVMSAEELAAAYREGEIRSLVMDEFICWIDACIAKLNKKHGETILDLDVIAVSIRAIGPFAKAIAE